MVYVVTVGPTSIFAYIGSLFLDVGIKLSLTSTAYALNFLTQGWTVARDISNIIFLFALIYTAFMIILRANSAGTTTTLALIIVMALLVNFSFFLTRVVIDAGNILAVQVYNAIPIPANQNLAATAGCTTGNQGGAQQNYICDPTTKDFTSTFMGSLQLQGLYQNTSFNDWASRTSGIEQLLTLIGLYIATAIVLAILGFIFLSVGAKFLVRIVALWFLIISAPLAFAAYALPQTQAYFKRWRIELLKNTFYPAVFLFMFLIVIIFVQQGCPATSQNQCLGILANIFSAQNGQVPNTNWYQSLGIAMTSIAIVMSLIVLMLFIAMKVADKVSVTGANITAKFPGWVAGQYAGGVSRLGGAALRNTLGRGGLGLSRSESLQNTAAQTGLRGMAARTLLRGGNVAATGSFDARGSTLAGGVLRRAGVSAGGPAGIGGRRGEVEARAKRQEQTAEMLRTSEAEKARRAQMPEAQKFLEEQQKAMGSRLGAEKELRDLTQKYSAETDKDKRKELDEERRRVQNSINSYRMGEDEAKRQREAFVGNTNADRERLRTFADTLDTTGRLAQLGMAPEGNIVGASRIRSNLPIAPIPPGTVTPSASTGAPAGTTPGSGTPGGGGPAAAPSGGPAGPDGERASRGPGANGGSSRTRTGTPDSGGGLDGEILPPEPRRAIPDQRAVPFDAGVRAPAPIALPNQALSGDRIIPGIPAPAASQAPKNVRVDGGAVPARGGVQRVQIVDAAGNVIRNIGAPAATQNPGSMNAAQIQATRESIQKAADTAASTVVNRFANTPQNRPFPAASAAQVPPGSQVTQGGVITPFSAGSGRSLTDAERARRLTGAEDAQFRGKIGKLLDNRRPPKEPLSGGK